MESLKYYHQILVQFYGTNPSNIHQIKLLSDREMLPISIIIEEIDKIKKLAGVGANIGWAITSHFVYLNE